MEVVGSNDTHTPLVGTQKKIYLFNNLPSSTSFSAICPIFPVGLSMQDNTLYGVPK